MNTPTFADLLTPAGIASAAVAIFTLVGLIKTVAPAIDRVISGALLAFLLSLALYFAAAIILKLGADGYLSCIWAWLACAAGAVGMKATVGHLANVTDGVAGNKPDITPISHDDFDESDAVEAAVAAAAVELPTEDPA